VNLHNTIDKDQENIMPILQIEPQIVLIHEIFQIQRKTN